MGIPDSLKDILTITAIVLFLGLFFIFLRKKLDGKTETHWSHNPFIVAFWSALIFGSLVVGLGSWLQHKNWEEEHEIATLTSFYEKTFEKRAEIAKQVFYFADMLRSNKWNLYDARLLGDDAEFRSTLRKGQHLSAQYRALLEEMRIYFDVSENDSLFKNSLDINNLWVKAANKIRDFSQKDKLDELTSYLNGDDTEITNRILKIRVELIPLIYKVDERVKQLVNNVMNQNGDKTLSPQKE